MPPQEETTWWRRRYNSSLLLLLLALALLVWGILRDEPPETRQNASFLCLECIGIG